MENPILLNARLKVKRNSIKTKETEIESLREKQNEILRAADEATTEKEVDDATSAADDNDKKIADLQKDVDQLKSDVSDIEKKLDDANSGDDDSAPNEKTPTTKSKDGEGEERMKVINRKEDKDVRGLIDFIQSKGEVRAGVTTTDIGAIIPKQIIYNAQEQVKTTYDLVQFVDVIKVSQAGGSYAIAEKVDDGLETVEELAANPDLGKPALITVDWALKTYRGEMGASNESIEDAQDLTGLINSILEQKVLNTNNKQISALLKTAPAKTAAATDDIKHIINVDLDPAYLNNGVIVASQSGIQFLDTLKDGNGNYLMQPDVTSPTGRRFLGLPVAVISDVLFGAQGDANAFIGDAKRFVKKFDKAELYLSYEQYHNFAKGFVAAIRADYKAVDTKAGYFVALGPKK
ncbi:MAG: phage major capsid protein [Lactobacillus sp.]|jgi:HK97 family phage major capsid protein|nr:phage major capsid protein [Lactobacillus sp.]